MSYKQGYADGFAEGYAAGLASGKGRRSSMEEFEMMNPVTQPKKRKPSAYQVWAKTERPKIVRQHPRFSFGRINQELGKRWKREKKKRGIE